MLLHMRLVKANTYLQNQQPTFYILSAHSDCTLLQLLHRQVLEKGLSVVWLLCRHWKMVRMFPLCFDWVHTTINYRIILCSMYFILLQNQVTHLSLSDILQLLPPLLTFPGPLHQLSTIMESSGSILLGWWCKILEKYLLTQLLNWVLQLEIYIHTTHTILVFQQ